MHRVERDRIVLAHGDLKTGPDVLVVDCTALGVRDAPAVPIFQPGRLVLQQVRHNSPPFNAALLAFVEAHREDDQEGNQLCPPNPVARSIEDWPRMMARTWRTEGRWLHQPDLSSWIAASRLNLLRALPDHHHDPRAEAAVMRYLTHVSDAIGRLERMAADFGADAARHPRATGR